MLIFLRRQGHVHTLQSLSINFNGITMAASNAANHFVFFTTSSLVLQYV